MGKQWKQRETLYSWAPKSLQMVTTAMKQKTLASWKKSYDKLSMLKSRDITLLTKVYIVKVKVLVARSSLTLCNPMDCSLPGSSVMEFSRQEHWSGLLFPSPGDLPDPGTESVSPVSPALAGGFSTAEPPGKFAVALFLKKQKQKETSHQSIS